MTWWMTRLLTIVIIKHKQCSLTRRSSQPPSSSLRHAVTVIEGSRYQGFKTCALCDVSKNQLAIYIMDSPCASRSAGMIQIPRWQSVFYILWFLEKYLSWLFRLMTEWSLKTVSSLTLASKGHVSSILASDWLVRVREALLLAGAGIPRLGILELQRAWLCMCSTVPLQYCAV